MALDEAGRNQTKHSEQLVHLKSQLNQDINRAMRTLKAPGDFKSCLYPAFHTVAESTGRQLSSSTTREMDARHLGQVPHSHSYWWR